MPQTDGVRSSRGRKRHSPSVLSASCPPHRSQQVQTSLVRYSAAEERIVISLRSVSFFLIPVHRLSPALLTVVFRSSSPFRFQGACPYDEGFKHQHKCIQQADGTADHKREKLLIFFLPSGQLNAPFKCFRLVKGCRCPSRISPFRHYDNPSRRQKQEKQKNREWNRVFRLIFFLFPDRDDRMKKRVFSASIPLRSEGGKTK